MSLDFDSARLRDPNLRPEHEEWRAQLRRFIDREIMPHVDDWDEACRIPDELWPKAAAIGLLGLGYPEDYGGTAEGIDIYHLNIVAEETRAHQPRRHQRIADGARHRPAAGGALRQRATMKSAVIPPMLRGEKHICLAITEPRAGRDVANIQTRAGATAIITSSRLQDCSSPGAWARTGSRRPCARAARASGGISVLLIPAGQRRRGAHAARRKQGWWCSDTAAIYFDEVRVPAANLVGPENMGFLGIDGELQQRAHGMAVGHGGLRARLPGGSGELGARAAHLRQAPRGPPGDPPQDRDDEAAHQRHAGLHPDLLAPSSMSTVTRRATSRC